MIQAGVGIIEKGKKVAYMNDEQNENIENGYLTNKEQYFASLKQMFEAARNEGHDYLISKKGRVFRVERWFYGK